MINHEINAAFLELTILEIHYSIANQNTL